MSRPRNQNPELCDAFTHPVGAMHACVRDNDMRKLRQLLQSPDSAKLLGHEHFRWGTPLHVAVTCDNLPAAEILIEAGADSLAYGSKEDIFPPVVLAARTGRREIMRRMLRDVDMPADGESENKRKSHAIPELPVRPSAVFIGAAGEGQTSIIGDLLDWRDEGAWTQRTKDIALLRAASRGQLHCVELLLARTAPFSRQTLNAALHRAADFKRSYQEEIIYHIIIRHEGVGYVNQQLLVAMLIDAGADPNSRVAPRQPRRSLHKHLTIRTANSVDLAGALKVLLEKGADPNATTVGNKTALHYLGSPAFVREPDNLMEVAVDDERRLNETGIRLLLRHGADVGLQDDAGSTPLHYAAFGSDERIFRLYLSSAGARDKQLVGTRNLYGESLLHWAAAGAKTDIIEYLFSFDSQSRSEAGSKLFDINETNVNGWTPLMCALARIDDLARLVRTARLLLAHGADPLISTGEGWTALHCLSLHFDAMGTSHDDAGDDDMAQLAEEFISRGADIEARAPLLPVARLGPSHPDIVAVRTQLIQAWGFRVKQDLEERAANQPDTVSANLTPLQWAARRGAVGVAKTLLAHGADASVQDSAGNTPDRMASESGSYQAHPGVRAVMVQLMADAGAAF